MQFGRGFRGAQNREIKDKSWEEHNLQVNKQNKLMDQIKNLNQIMRSRHN